LPERRSIRSACRESRSKFLPSAANIAVRKKRKTARTTTTTSAERIDGLLLAGGRSRRFGSDKRRATLAGRTLAEHALALLRSQIDGDLFVAGDGAFDREVAAYRVADAAPGKGPLGGIVGALAHARFGMLVVPCDAPFVRADTLAALAALGRRQRRTVVARSSRGLEPLVAFYPRTALPFLAAALREGTRALHRLLPRLHATWIDARDARELHNVNRPADLDLAAAWMRDQECR
jgi:molybdopterin-guanine dinucleotide biosynthesis protein A